MSEPRRRVDREALLAMRIPARTFSYDETYTMLYGLAVGMGRDPLDRRQLRYVTEPHLVALPTMATVIAWHDTWLDRTGLDVANIVHGEQRVTLHRPVPPAGTVSSAARILDVFDKGVGRGALLYVETLLTEAGEGLPLATLHSTIFARGDGGFGGSAGGPPPLQPIPGGAPAMVVTRPTAPGQALLYRLLGDRNPLHWDPDFARGVGYDRPILHGLCTYGFAAAALVEALCDDDPARVAHMEARFTAPVFPGETIITEIWPTADGGAFRARVAERDAVVLDLGRVVLR